MNIYIFIIISYFALVILISFLTKKMASRSTSDFLVAGRNLGVVVCAVVVAAEWLGGMSTIGVSEQAFNTGTLRPILYNIATALGMVIIGFTVASHYRKKDVHTVSEMLKFLFGDNVRTVSAISFLLAYITLAYVQLQTCAGLFGPLLGLDWITSVIISSVIITIYTYIGGMHALAITGVIHVVVMFLGIGIATFIGMDKVGGFEALQTSLMATGAPENFYNPFSGGMSKAFSLLLGGILGGMAGQASIQPIFAAKNAITAKRAAIVSSMIIAPFGIMVAFLGLIAKTGVFFEISSITNPKMVLSTLLTTPEFIHPVLGGIALAGVLAAILSTVGPVNFAIVTIATKDIYQGIIHKKVDDKKLLKTAKRMVLLVNVVTIPLAIFIHGAILEAAYVSYAIRAIGAIVIILGIYKRNWITSSGVVLAFIGGTITIFVCILANKMGWFSVDKTYGAVISAIVFILIGNLWEKFR
ncbi:MAG: sodium:solute symporter family protein [Candidatus Delongbacteria bacterium]|jgi:SSS family solute:Na+ symporter|nr:sodium:solute symporter family protein [Candidatus Delongbacteria bacterium]